MVPVNGAVASSVCSGCTRTIAISSATWPEVLREAVDEGARGAVNDERVSSLRTEAGTCRLVYRRVPGASCGCGAPAPLDDRAAIERGFAFCGSCRQRLSIRAAPTGLEGARLLVGERDPAHDHASAEAQAVRARRAERRSRSRSAIVPVRARTAA